ncbi:hypothetical protein JTB14_027718 [Gonioctena quinquepunctata]|nr:hypothetical protein JTB14_027718 [Gonioctena quinquepunctata]
MFDESNASVGIPETVEDIAAFLSDAANFNNELLDNDEYEDRAEMEYDDNDEDIEVAEVPLDNEDAIWTTKAFTPTIHPFEDVDCGCKVDNAEKSSLGYF